MTEAGAPLLEVSHVDASYGPFRALFDVSFAVPTGTTVALLGPNGAGKSTVARVVSGLIHPTRGKVVFDGVEVTRTPAWKIARMGLAHAPEGRAVFGSLSVTENLELAFRSAAGSRELPRLFDVAFGAFPRLGERRDQLAETLSGGEQHMLALARVLAAPPKFMVVDEISLGLAPVVVDEVYEGLRQIRKAGTTLLIVEQQITRALDMADLAVVLSKGEVSMIGPVSDVRTALSAPTPLLTLEEGGPAGGEPEGG